MDNLSFEGIYDVLRFGAVGDGVTDDTAAFQAALDKAGEKGGIVYAAPGNYLFKGRLNVPVGVTLRGSFECVPAHNGHRDKGLPKPGEYGTVLLPTADAGNENAPAFITLNTNATLKGLLIYYPEQVDDRDPIPYPWTVAMRGKNPALLDCELLNPYNAVDASNNERHMIARMYGQPLRRGIFVDAIYDIGRIEDVHFNPWWSLKKPIEDFMVREGEAFIIGRTDWEYMFNCFAIFYKVGFIFDDFGHGPGNAMLTQCGHDIAPVTVQVRKTQPHAGVSFTNSQFMGDFEVCETNEGPVHLNNCGFWGVKPGERGEEGTASNLRLRGPSHVILNACHMTDWNMNPALHGETPAVDLDCATCVISSCDFMLDKLHIRVGEHVKDCVIMGNRFAGGAKIEEARKGHAQIGLNMNV